MSRTTPGSADGSGDRHLFTPRTALILLLAVLAGSAAVALSVWAGQHIAQALLVGAGATAAAIAFFNWLISPS